MAFVAELQQSPTTQDLLSVDFVDLYKGWIGGTAETLIRTGNSGSTWTVEMTGGAGSFDKIKFQDWYNGTIAATACWGPKPDPNYHGTVHVVYYNNGSLVRDYSAVLRTSNSGSTWVKQFVPTNFVVSSAQFISPSTGMITAFGDVTHTDSDIWYTTDNGATAWGRYPTWSYLMDQMMIDAKTWWVVGDFIFNTSDGGNNWDSAYGTGHLNATYFLDSQTGWVVGENGGISNTISGGKNWSKQISGVTTDLNDVEFTSASDGWVVGAKGTIIHTMDGGKTWSSLQSPTSKDLRAVDFPSPDFGWAVGDSGKIVFIHNGTPPPPPQGKLASVQVTPSSANMNVSDTKKFSASALDSYGNPIQGLNYQWSLSQQLGTLTQLGPNEVEFKATTAGSTVLTADTSYNGTNGKGTSTITITVPPPPNKAPGTPTTTGPASGNTNQSLSYNITSTDPDNDQVKYLVDWGDGTNQTTQLGASGWKATLTHSWSTQGSYNVKAKCIDAKGAESAWSSPLAIAISKSSGGGSPPSAPIITGPAQGKPVAEYSYTLTSTDPDNDKVMFTIDWGDGKGDTTGFDVSGALVIVKHAWESDGNYTLKVKVRDATGLESSWTSKDVHIETNIQDQPPAIIHTPVIQATEGTQVVIQATITDDFQITGAVLFHRQQRASSWMSVQMQGVGPQYTAIIPASAVVKGVLEYYIQAEDDGGNIARSPASGASNPYTVTVKEKGTGATNNTQSPKGIDPMLILAISVVAILAVVVIVALLLIRKRGKRGQATPYPTYYPEPWAYPQQGSTGYPDQSNYPNQQPQEVRTW